MTASRSGGPGKPCPRPLTEGVYVPTVAFFTPDTTAIDVPTTKSHAQHLASAGISGIVTHGSNGEAIHLDPQERTLVTQATRQALDESGHHLLPIIAGCGAQSTRETLVLCGEAHAAGADYALVLPPSYYKGIQEREQLVEFFVDVADGSPLPIVIYNFPGAAGGVNLDSDMITQLAAHPNIRGVKLTCGDTGKLARVAFATSKSMDITSNGSHDGYIVPMLAGYPFLVLAGSADFILQTLIVGGSGTIAGLANLGPRTCVRAVQLFRRFEATGDPQALQEARKIQGILARADWVAIKGGFPVVKDALMAFKGYGGSPRKPCRGLSGEQQVAMEKGLQELMSMEKSLEKAGQ